MSDELRRTRRAVTDPEALADFHRRSVDAFEAALREDDPHISDERVGEVLSRAKSAVAWATVRVRRKGTQTTSKEDHGLAATSEDLTKLRRHLPGAANRGGRTTGTNAVGEAGGDTTIRAIVADLRRNHRKVKLETIAAASGAFTRDNLRYWLRKNGKRLGDY